MSQAWLDLAQQARQREVEDNKLSGDALLSANSQTETILGKEVWSRPIQLNDLTIFYPSVSPNDK
jgi:hypothetical protein